MSKQSTIPTRGWPAAPTAGGLAAPPPGERPSCRDTGVREAAATSPAVLIVDDEEILADALRSYLVRCGYEVELAGSGEDALARMRQSGLDLVVLDYGLPGMDGLETLRQLKQLAPCTEVIMLSAHGTAKTAEEAMRLGAFDYLAKPIDLVEVHVALDKAWAWARRHRRPNVLQDAPVA